MRAALLLALSAALASCADGAARRDAGPAPQPPSVPSLEPSAAVPVAASRSGRAFEGTVGIVERERDGAPALLSALRASEQAGYDRVVFEFAGEAPGYHVEYVDRPLRSCGSGDPVPVAGDAWLAVRLTPATAHTEAGQPTLDFRERALVLPNVVELQSLCDFEAHVEWAIGVSSPTGYRVTEMSSPARLVVDVLHAR